MHGPAAKKEMDCGWRASKGRCARSAGMIAADQPCEAIAQQLAAARRALDRSFYEMVACMIRQAPPAGVRERGARAGRIAELLSRFG
jgi:hypothetical protein